MPALRRHAALLLLPLLALGGCNPPRPPAPAPDEKPEVRVIDVVKFDSDPKPQPEFKPPDKEAPLRFTLAATPNLSPDDLSVRLKVENSGHEPFDWDTQFVGGLEWRVAVSDGNEFIAPEVLELDGGKTAKRERAHLKIIASGDLYPWLPDRFERLGPGQSLTGEFKLQMLGSQANKVDVERRKTTDANKVEAERDVRVLKQEFAAFTLPPGAKLVRVQARYSPSNVTMRVLQKREQLKIAPAAESNALEIQWK
jgi:hypothetical protein